MATGVPQPGQPRPQLRVEEPTRLAGRDALDYSRYSASAASSERPQAPASPGGPGKHEQGGSGAERQSWEDSARAEWEAWALSQKLEFLRLEGEVGALEGVEQRLRAQEVLVKQLDSATLSARRAREEAVQYCQERREKLEKVTGRSLAKFFRTKKGFQKEVERREGSLESAEALLAAREARERSLQAARVGPSCELDELRQQNVQKTKSVARELEILERLFAGPAGSPEENAIEQHVHALALRHTQIEPAFAEQQRALFHMRRTLEALERAALLLRQASASQGVDMLTGGGVVGTFSGMATQLNLAEAKEHTRKAQWHIQEALRLSPFMPAARAGIHSGGILLTFVNIGFDNIFTDLFVMHKVREAARNVEGAYREALYSYQWLEGFLSNIASDRAVNFDALQTARGRLLEERTRLLRRIGEGMAEAKETAVVMVEHPGDEPLVVGAAAGVGQGGGEE